MAIRRLIQTEYRQNTLILELDKGASQFADAELLNELRDIIKQIDKATINAIVVDIGQLSYFGSIILESLRKLWQQVRTNDGKMVLCNVSEVSREILHISKFDTLWPICESVEEALAQVKQ